MKKLSISDSSLEEDFLEVSNSAAEFFPDKSEEQICDALIGILREYQGKADWHGRKPMEPQNFLSWDFGKRQTRGTSLFGSQIVLARPKQVRGPLLIEIIFHGTATPNEWRKGNAYSNFSIG